MFKPYYSARWKDFHEMIHNEPWTYITQAWNPSRVMKLTSMSRFNLAVGLSANFKIKRSHYNMCSIKPPSLSTWCSDIMLRYILDYLLVYPLNVVLQHVKKCVNLKKMFFSAVNCMYFLNYLIIMHTNSSIHIQIYRLY